MNGTKIENNIEKKTTIKTQKGYKKQRENKLEAPEKKTLNNKKQRVRKINRNRN